MIKTSKQKLGKISIGPKGQGFNRLFSPEIAGSALLKTM